MDAPIPRDLASRLANAASGIDGVRSAVVCSAEGAVLGSAGAPEPAKDAALASFIALRAEALSVDGDLRGMGRQLAGSAFSHLAVSGVHDETLLYTLNNGAYLSVQLAPGRSTAAAQPLTSLVRRVAAMPTTTRSS